MNRSVRLRKYQSAYELCISKIENLNKYENTKKSPSQKLHKRSPQQKHPRSPQRRPPRSPPRRSKTEKKEKEEVKSQTPLNPYQLFVREQSQKNKYRSMSPKTRMTHISKAWAKKKRST
jgi:hypothetical protein